MPNSTPELEQQEEVNDKPVENFKPKKVDEPFQPMRSDDAKKLREEQDIPLGKYVKEIISKACTARKSGVVVYFEPHREELAKYAKFSYQLIDIRGSVNGNNFDIVGDVMTSKIEFDRENIDHQYLYDYVRSLGYRTCTDYTLSVGNVGLFITWSKE